MVESIWGNDPLQLILSKANATGGGGSTPHNIYYNPRATVYFADYPPEVGEISDIVDYNILGDTLRRGEFSPSIDGTPSDPPAGGWRGDAHLPFYWDGETTQFKIEAIVSLGRQTPPQVDARLYVKHNGVEVLGANTITSLSRAPTGNQGASTMNLSLFLTLNSGDNIEVLINRVGVNATVLTDINVFAAQLSVTALKTEELPLVIFP